MDYQYDIVNYINFFINVLFFVYYAYRKKTKLKENKNIITKDVKPRNIENNVIDCISHNVLPIVEDEIIKDVPKVSSFVKINLDQE